MSNYDSILKEKNTYEELDIKKDDGPKPFPWFRIDLICLIILLGISYIIYYTKVLTPDNIFLNDLKQVYDKYEGILDDCNIDYFINNNYNLLGNLEFSDKSYDIALSKFEDKIKFNMGINEDSINYYTTDNNTYLKVDSFKDTYYKQDSNNYLNILFNIKDYLENKLPKDKFIKKFYLNGTTPIVESNLVLNTENIKTALGLNSLKNSHEVLFTFKNNAISNRIISMKVIINNSTTGRRGVLTYENGYITYTENDIVYKFILEKDNDNFRLNIYKDDILYSVLSGTKKEVSYEYLYQVIDEVYNITVVVKNEDDIYSYQITSNI